MSACPRRIFIAYCSEGQKDIDAEAFAMICRDFRFIDHTFTETDSNAVFATVMRGRMRMDFPSFGSAMRLVAKAKGMDTCVLWRALANPGRGAEGRAGAPVVSDPHSAAKSWCMAVPEDSFPTAPRRPAVCSSSKVPAVDLTGKGRGQRHLVEQSFKVFCGAQHLMDRSGFVTFCRSTHLVTESGFVDRDFDLIFDKVVPGGHMGMNLAQFRAALSFLLRIDRPRGSVQKAISPQIVSSLGGLATLHGEEHSSCHTKSFVTQLTDDSLAHKALMYAEMLQTEDKAVDLHRLSATLSLLVDLDPPACQQAGSGFKEIGLAQRSRYVEGLKDDDSTCPTVWSWSDMAPSCSTTASPVSSRSSSPSRTC